MESHEKTTDLLDQTMDTLEGDISTMVPESGRGVIDQWLEQLRKGENTTELVDSLERLKNQLEGSRIDSAELEQQLMTIADQTVLFGTKVGEEGDLVTRLQALAASLRLLAGQLHQK